MDENKFAFPKSKLEELRGHKVVTVTLHKLNIRKILKINENSIRRLCQYNEDDFLLTML